MDMERNDEGAPDGGKALTRTLEIHFKLFGTDGVSLQSQELSKALSARGWRSFAGASDVPRDVEGLTLSELSYQSPDAVALRKRVFSTSERHLLASDGDSLVMEITKRAEPIRRQIEEYVDARQIPLLHIRNIMSLPYNLPATRALYDLATERPDLGFLMQHHDIYWEGPNARNFLTPYQQVNDMMDRIMCPSLPNARHVLINPLAAEARASLTPLFRMGSTSIGTYRSSMKSAFATGSRFWSAIRDRWALRTWWWQCRPESRLTRRSNSPFSLWQH
jgi:hypothetical protein